MIKTQPDFSEYDFQNLDKETQWVIIRATRNRRLTACDWTQLPDVALTDKQKNMWCVYRQNLRDLPTQSKNASDIIWPAVPEK